MRQVVTFLMVGALAAWAAPGSAQEKEQAPLIAKTYLVDVAPADIAAFEAALREHFSRQATPPDPWAWYTWEVVNGPHHGRYVIRSHGHRWQDFDARAALDRLDRADFSATVAPHIRAISSRLEKLEPALSSWSANAKRPALVEVITYQLTPEGARDFTDALTKVQGAVSARRPELQYSWSVVVNGDDGPTMVLAMPLDSWSEMASRTYSPWPAVAEQYGAEEAAHLRRLMEEGTRSRRSVILALREDLSYEPK